LATRREILVVLCDEIEPIAFDFENETGETIENPRPSPDHRLVRNFYLQHVVAQKGHCKAACAWAIYELLCEELLTPEVAFGREVRNKPTEAYAPPPLGKGPIIYDTAEFDRLLLRTTDALWEEWRKEGVANAVDREVDPARQFDPFSPECCLIVSARGLLKLAGLPDDNRLLDRLEKRLLKFRAESDAGWVEVQNRQMNQAKYYYYPYQVKSVIEAVRASLELPTE